MSRYFTIEPIPGPLGRIITGTAVLSGVHHTSLPLSRYILPDFRIAFGTLVNIAEFAILLFLLRTVMESIASSIRRLLRRP